MSKKNIDDIFREKFKDFGEIPDDKVWKSIEASLDQKKRNRRFIPIWWKLGGVAAVLAILFYVMNPFASDEDVQEIITGAENTETQKTDSLDSIEKKDNIFESPDRKKEAVVTTDADDADNKLGAKKAGETNLKRSVTTDTDESIANTSKRKRDVLGNMEDKNDGISKIQSNTDPNQYVDTTGKEDAEVPAREMKTAVAASDDSEKNNGGVINKDQKKIVPNDPALKKSPANKAVVQIGEKQKDSMGTSKKKSIFDEILEEEEEAVTDKSGGRWSVGPSVAPVYFDSFGEGSPIHSSFVSNSKSGNVNLSYGVAVSYEVSEKLSIRSGVHKVDYGYDTNEVLFSSSFTAASNGQISNISYSDDAKNLVVRSSISPNSATQEDFSTADVLAAKNPSRIGRMVQEFGYLEIPVELNYALVEKKLGVNLIGGISSLFLTDNSITLESDGNATEVGEANNINKINFSTNVGFGINYKVTPKIQLNLEPMFKYQLNTFSDTDGNFQAFSVGVYSGLNFKF